MPEFASDMERIEFALKTEHDGHTFYQKAAKKTSHKLARAAFELLGKEELRHVALIEGLGKQLGGEGGEVEVEEVTLKALETDLKTIYGAASEETIEDEMDPAEAVVKEELWKEFSDLMTRSYRSYRTGIYNRQSEEPARSE